MKDSRRKDAGANADRSMDLGGDETLTVTAVGADGSAAARSCKVSVDQNAAPATATASVTFNITSSGVSMSETSIAIPADSTGVGKGWINSTLSVESGLTINSISVQMGQQEGSSSNNVGARITGDNGHYIWAYVGILNILSFRANNDSACSTYNGVAGTYEDVTITINYSDTDGTEYSDTVSFRFWLI